MISRKHRSQRAAKRRQKQQIRNEIVSLSLSPSTAAPEGMAYKISGEGFTMLTDQAAAATIAAAAIQRELGKDTFVSLGNTVILGPTDYSKPSRRSRGPNTG